MIGAFSEEKPQLRLLSARFLYPRLVSLRDMRIKVECVPPLAHLKAWVIVPAVSTVLDLKGALCSEIPALQEQDIAADGLTLVLDGFELLDTCPIDVVRDGDLIT